MNIKKTVTVTDHSYYVVETTTDVRYDDHNKYFKYDYFKVPKDVFESLTPKDDDELYDLINDGGYWQDGFHDTTDEFEKWLDEHDSLGGSQDEIVVGVKSFFIKSENIHIENEESQ
jgi:hypothetical protein